MIPQADFIELLCDAIRHDGMTALEAVKRFCVEYRVSITYCVDCGIVQRLRAVANRGMTAQET